MSNSENSERISLILPLRKYILSTVFKKFERFFLERSIKKIERKIGSKLLVAIPESLNELTTDSIRLADGVKSLQEIGMIKRVVLEPHQFADEPFAFQAEAKPYGFGIDLFDKEKAFFRAIGEQVERHLWFNSEQFYKNKTVRLSVKDARKKGGIDLINIAGFSQNQRKQSRHLQFDDDTFFEWIETKNILTGNNTLCPVQLISSRFLTGSKEPLIRWSVSTGLAAGPTLDKAILKGLLECIERDAFMISYLNKLSPPVLNLETIPETEQELAHIKKICRDFILDLKLIRLPTNFPVEVILALLIDHTGIGPALTVGASASFSLQEASIHAFKEALQSRLSLRKEPEASLPKFSKFGRIERLKYWANKNNIENISFFWAGKIESWPETSREKIDTREAINILKKSFREKHYTACYAKLSTANVDLAGFPSVCVVTPELQPLHLHEKHPYIGGERLHKIPRLFGYTPAKKMNTIPHPFP